MSRTFIVVIGLMMIAAKQAVLAAPDLTALQALETKRAGTLT